MPTILAVQHDQILPAPELAGVCDFRCTGGSIAQGAIMICFLDLLQIFDAALLWKDAA